MRVILTLQPTTKKEIAYVKWLTQELEKYKDEAGDNASLANWFHEFHLFETQEEGSDVVKELATEVVYKEWQN